MSTHTLFEIKFLKDSIVNVLGFMCYILSLHPYVFVLFYNPLETQKPFLVQRYPIPKQTCALRVYLTPNLGG